MPLTILKLLCNKYTLYSLLIIVVFSMGYIKGKSVVKERILIKEVEVIKESIKATNRIHTRYDSIPDKDREDIEDILSYNIQEYCHTDTETACLIKE